MIYIRREKVLLLHQIIAQETGGSSDVLDFGLVDSALESAYATFDGKDIFPSKEEKATKLGYDLITNHAFIDGNKRIGMHIMLTFLLTNGITLNVSNQEVIELGKKIENGNANYLDVLAWIIKHEA